MAIAVKNLRWWIVALLAAATALNYLDRQSFPVVADEIKKEIPFSTVQYGRLSSIFLFAYAIMYAGGGWVLDRLGTRAGYATMIAWWSAANFLTGLVTSVLGLGVCRFLLGMGEGGGFPGSSKAVAEWFRPEDRAMAFGIFNTGSAVGAVVAPPLIAFLVVTLGWRSVFFVTGGAGLVCAAVWLKFYQPPARSPLISAADRQLLVAALRAGSAAAAPQKIPWLRLFGYGQVRGLMAAKFFSDSSWFFLIFWLPKYLGESRHLDIRQIGAFAWIPYAFAGVGSFSGGWLNGLLIRRGLTLDRARKVTLSLGALLAPISFFIVEAPLSLALVFFSLAMFAHQFLAPIIMTLVADLFPASVVGSVGGLLGSAGAFGGMLFGLLVGWLVETRGYGPAFALAGILEPMALVVILASVGRIGPILALSGRQEQYDCM